MLATGESGNTRNLRVYQHLLKNRLTGDVVKNLPFQGHFKQQQHGESSVFFPPEIGKVRGSGSFPRSAGTQNLLLPLGHLCRWRWLHHTQNYGSDTQTWTQIRGSFWLFQATAIACMMYVFLYIYMYIHVHTKESKTWCPEMIRRNEAMLRCLMVGCRGASRCWQVHTKQTSPQLYVKWYGLVMLLVLCSQILNTT